MIFNFDFNKFTNYYQKLPKIQSQISWDIFYKKYSHRGYFSDYKWDQKTINAISNHPYLSNLYITFENTNYTFFNIPTEINGILYGNHISVGYKTFDQKLNKHLIDLHYTIQDPITKKSYNEETKCWLYNGKQIDTNTLFSENCIIPKGKTYSNVYNDLFINYIILILATPFINLQNNKEVEEIEDIAKKLKATNSEISNPFSSPAGGKLKNSKKTKIFIGPRGGKYILNKNNKKKYIK